MRHLFLDKNWIFKDLNQMIKFVGNYDRIWSHKLYEYWLTRINKREVMKYLTQLKISLIPMMTL